MRLVFELTVAILIMIQASNCLAQNASKVIKAGGNKLSEVKVSPLGTVLSFSESPSDVILGKQKSFQIKVINRDIAVAALYRGAVSNLFIYIGDSRYTFRLRQVASSGDQLVQVVDENSSIVEVPWDE